MRAKNTIVINGKVYDAISGLPAGAPDPIATTSVHDAPKVHHPAKTAGGSAPVHTTTAKTVHRHTQRSKTLRRDIVKAPTPTHHADIRRKPQAGHHAQSSRISKFAPHPQALDHQPAAVAATSSSTHHNAVAHAPHSQPSRPHTPPQRALSSRELKEKLIAERLASIQEPKPAQREHKAPKRGLFANTPRVSSVLAASFAVVILGGYLTYITMPNLSMRVAASRAGVDASFPNFRPDGYRFDGPIAYNSGEVSLKFASNTNAAGYTINQKNSTWDSQAVLDNYVSKKSSNYLTFSEQGLTIYTYENKAAWVNGGVLYTIEGDAPLSSDQILRIAGSM